MAKKDYMPRSDAEFAPWLHNFAVKLPNYQVAFGLDPAVIARPSFFNPLPL